MKLTKGKISKLYNQKKQSFKKYNNKKKAKNYKSFRNKKYINLANKSLKQIKKGGTNDSNPLLNDTNQIINVTDSFNVILNSLAEKTADIVLKKINTKDTIQYQEPFNTVKTQADTAANNSLLPISKELQPQSTNEVPVNETPINETPINETPINGTLISNGNEQNKTIEDSSSKINEIDETLEPTDTELKNELQTGNTNIYKVGDKVCVKVMIKNIINYIPCTITSIDSAQNLYIVTFKNIYGIESETLSYHEDEIIPIYEKIDDTQPYNIGENVNIIFAKGKYEEGTIVSYEENTELYTIKITFKGIPDEIKAPYQLIFTDLTKVQNGNDLQKADTQNNNISSTEEMTSLNQTNPSENITNNISEPISPVTTSENNSELIQPVTTSENTSEPISPVPTSENTSELIPPVNTSEKNSELITPVPTSENNSELIPPVTTSENNSEPISPVTTSEKNSEPISPVNTSENNNVPINQKPPTEPGIEMVPINKPSSEENNIVNNSNLNSSSNISSDTNAKINKFKTKKISKTLAKGNKRTRNQRTKPQIPVANNT